MVYKEELSLEKVKKRNGTIVSYDSEKIANCIRKACKDVKDTMSKEELKQIVSEIEGRLSGIKIPGVERIQDTVESVLMKTKHEKAAKAYIIYRSEHAKIRDTQQTLIDKMMEVTFKTGEESDYKRSNANIPSDTTMGSMLIYGTTVSNYFNDNYVYPKRYIAADRKGLIHIHKKIVA
jgi:ribonucleoside-triphosphate reductase